MSAQTAPLLGGLVLYHPPVRTNVLRIASVLRLTRVSTAFAAVADVWFVILWSRHGQGELPSPALADTNLWILLIGGALAAAGLYAFGTCLNDIFDQHRDAQLRPGRPLPSGYLQYETAVVVTAVTMIAAVLGAATFGTVGVILTLTLLLAILVLSATGKFIPGIGLVLLSLIYAGHMFVPNINLVFVWPVWLVMTHALVVAGLAHVLGRKTPPLTRRAIAFAASGWVLATIGLFSLASMETGIRGLSPFAHGAVGPIACLVLIAIYTTIVVRRSRAVGRGPRLDEKIKRYGSIWLSLYACAWLFGAGLTGPGFIMAGLAATGIIGMVVLRELYGLVEHPVGYRH